MGFAWEARSIGQMETDPERGVDRWLDPEGALSMRAPKA